MNQDYIIINGARENNLKNISLQIPKNKITVFTGVSGSGKSSLVFDTIANEAQRQLNETYGSYIRNRLPKFSKPDADSIENLSVAIVVDQKRLGGNSRSTLGTITEIYSLLRLLFSRMGNPTVGSAHAFSFNSLEGMCPKCQGIGKTITVDIELMFDKNKSLNDGGILFPVFAVGTWYHKTYTNSGLFDNDKKLGDYSNEEWEKLLYGRDAKVNYETAGGIIQSEYEGVVNKFERLYIKRDISDHSDNTKNKVENYTTLKICPSCNGKRLSERVLSSKIQGFSIAEMSAMEIKTLRQIIAALDNANCATVIQETVKQLDQMIAMGLGYLCLDRETTTLSGGESQRVKMVKYLQSNLIGLTYIFDEPSIGLHPRDVQNLNQLLLKLRDKGNTVLVVEHDADVILIADHVVDIGPHAGERGGTIVYQGDLPGILRTETLTGKSLMQHTGLKVDFRTPSGWYDVTNVTINNLKQVSVNIPKNVLTVVTGVAGSGKSTLINGAFISAYNDTVMIDQKAVSSSIRSTPATYAGIMDEIRTLFAKANKVNASLFSFNSKGACPSCQGLGFIWVDLAYLDGVRSHCETCEGKRFNDDVLRLQYKGKSIGDVLDMTINEALFFFESPTLVSKLQNLEKVGMGYITLGQPLNTLSGGECQRLKLAKELNKSGSVYIMDEPTTGLHLSDITKIKHIIDQLVDNGNTVIVIEHNLEIIKSADWIIDLGPEAGKNGGKIVFEGRPDDLIKSTTSITGKFLKASLKVSL